MKHKTTIIYCARALRLSICAMLVLLCAGQSRASVFGDVRGIVFDPQHRARAPYRLSAEQYIALWSRIACPTLLLRGSESFLPDPVASGLVGHLAQAEARTILGAGHWLQHDRLDEVLGELHRFLGTSP